MGNDDGLEIWLSEFQTSTLYDKSGGGTVLSPYAVAQNFEVARGNFQQMADAMVKLLGRIKSIEQELLVLNRFVQYAEEQHPGVMSDFKAVEKAKNFLGVREDEDGEPA